MQNTISVHKYLRRLRFIIKSQSSFLFRRITRKFTTRVKEICQCWTPGYQLPRKGVIVYADASDWFRGKIDSLYQGRKTLYRAKILEFTSGNTYCWLGEHGSKAKITLESIGEGITKNYGVF